ncbi:MAG: NAD(P)(+) transhydrogenase (Re/Si-specific) subunit alpha, partial [Candidatus Latescibacterota bacterium]
VKGMRPGSVIVDIAAEKGGNCELTVPGQTVVKHGVTIIGASNLATSLPTHASQMYSKNVITFLGHIARKGVLKVDLEDEITKGTLVTQAGKVVNPAVLDAISRG